MPRRAPKLDELSSSYLECRDIRHSWETLAYFNWKVGVLGRKLYCSRCTTVRYDFIDRKTGNSLKKRGYGYPEDYLLEPGTGRIGLGEVRLAQFTRLGRGALSAVPDELTQRKDK